MAQRVTKTTTSPFKDSAMNATVVGQSLQQTTTPGRAAGGGGSSQLLQPGSAMEPRAAEGDAAAAGGASGGGGGGGAVVAPSVAWSSQPGSPKDFSMVDQVMKVNRSLVQQIDALRLRLQVDSRHHESTRHQLLQDADQKLKTRDEHILELKGELMSREVAVKTLKEHNRQKQSDIQGLQRTIDALKKDVDDSKLYVDDIQSNLNVMQEEKEKLESGAAYKEKDELIRRLSTEVQEMRGNLSRLERELAKAKEVVSTQGSKLRLMEHDRHNMHLKFKDELERANHSMRAEVEKIREVMKHQWEEMRRLRMQNENMVTDIKEIKDLLLTSSSGDQSSPSAQQPQGTVYNMGALKPSLPALTNTSARRNISGKKKPL